MRDRRSLNTLVIPLIMWLATITITITISITTAQIVPVLPDVVTTEAVRFPARQPKTPPARVYPGTDGFPEMDEFIKLLTTLEGKGELVSAMQEPQYYNLTLMMNLRTTKMPYMHFLVESVEDVQKLVLFAKKHNLFLAIRSTGHSFIGRSTHDGAIVINFANMKGKQFNLDSDRNQAGEITVQSGSSWLEVYEAVDQQVTHDAVGNAQRRVIIGGSAHTVGMGGYTQGGGHSPMCRQLGLAVDNLLEATVVLADGSKAVVNGQGTTATALDGTISHSNDTSLFWALRGGGGATWGVVIDFTFKLHYAPKRFRNIASSWALTYKGGDIGSQTIKFVLQQLAQLSPQWGGYLLVSGAQLDANTKGAVTVFLNHFGTDDDASNDEVTALLNHNTYKHQFNKKDITFPTFMGYEKPVVDSLTTNQYLFNTFVQPSLVQNVTQLDELTDFFMSLIHPPTADSAYSCTGAMIGGKMGDVPKGDTPIHPKFRSGLMSLSCSLSWPAFVGRDSFFEGYAMLKRDELHPMGEGTYFNECAEDLPNWKEEFWGMDNYNRLLTIKRQYDPHHLFWCHNCVGSDEATSA